MPTSPIAPPPTVSVIIPARNAAHSITGALQSVLDQDYPRIVDVAVAAADPATLAAAAATGDPRVSAIPNPEGTTPAALNLALAATTGEFVVRCDTHAQLPDGYIARAVRTLVETGAANVGGRQAPRGETLFERAVGLAMVSPVGAGDARYRVGGEAGPVDTVYLGAFRRSSVEAVGGFDETLIRNQDYELNWRLRQSGETVWFDPALVVDYRPRGSLQALARQYWEYGRWKRAMLARHPGSMRWRQLAPPALWLGLVASVVLGLLGHALLSLAIPVGYLSLTTGAALGDLIKSRDPAAILEPAALWTMHLAWGLGFIVGPPRRTP